MGKSNRMRMNGFNDGERFEKNNDCKNFRKHTKNVLRNLKNVSIDDIDEDYLNEEDLIIENDIEDKEYKKPFNKNVKIKPVTFRNIKDPEEILRLLGTKK